MDRVEEAKQLEKQSPWHILLDPRYAKCHASLTHQQLREKHLPLLKRIKPPLKEDFSEWIDSWPHARPAKLNWSIDPMTGEIGEIVETYSQTPCEADVDFDQLVAGKNFVSLF